MTDPDRYAPLRAALEPDLRIEQVLRESPEGAAYVARELTLERRVLVKAIDRSRAADGAVAAFIQEAKVLAALSDPRLPAIHHAGEIGGFLYIVRELAEGVTLEDRLRDRPLVPPEVRRLGIEVLDALDTVHAAGFAHGSVETRQVILGPTRVVLDGFGAAVPATESAVRDDLEAVARLLHRAAGGTLPPALHAAVGLALDAVPPTARIFRAHLAAAAPLPARRARGWAMLGAALILGAAYVGAREPPGPPGPAPRLLAVLPFDVDGGQPLDPLGANLAHLIQLGLEEVPGLELTPRAQVDRWWADQAHEEQPADGFTAARVLRVHWAAHGAVDRRPDGTLRVRLSLYDSAGATRALPEIRAPAGDLATLSDSLGLALLRVVAPLSARGLEPRGLAGVPLPALKAFLRGEVAFARDEWALAQRHYESALGLDSTFALADWRLANIKRWRRLSQGSELAAVYERHASRLRSRDRLLIEALLEPDLEARFARLDTAVGRFPADGYARLLQGEELFHLGPLAGQGVDEALPVMAAAVALDSSLALAYDHLVLGHVRSGRRKEAREALELRRRVGEAARDDEIDLLPFLELVYDERFVPWRAWVRYQLIRQRGSPRQLDGVHRLARVGTPWLDMPHTQLRYCDLLLRAGPAVAEIHGTAHQGKGLALFALGRLREALAELDSAAALFDSPEARLQQAEWRVVPAALGYPGIDTKAWEPRLRELAGDSTVGARAAWAIALLAGDDTARARPWLDRLPDGSPLGVLSHARLAASRGDLAFALALTDSLRSAFQGPPPADPFAGAVLHVLRGDWFAAAGAPDRADREWLWHEASDVEGWPVGLAQSGEIGAALGPLARLRRARALLAPGGSAADTLRACAHVARVRELWADADPALRALPHDAVLGRTCPR